jgi:membrane-bound ClpP family serine protease
VAIVRDQSRVNAFVNNQLDRFGDDLEQKVDADVMALVGPIVYGADDIVRLALESRDPKRPKLAVVLDTSGGLVEVVERIVRTLRHHYGEVVVIVPDRAMSAGTVLAMSGDAIMMDYYAVLGPIDPQVQNQSGNLVPALSYLVQFERLKEKSQKGELTAAEIVLLQNLDLAELHSYEEARELSTALLEEWLATYKFKNWITTETSRKPVTPELRKKRAREIAEALSDNQRWHSHARTISMDVLTNDLNLKIDDFAADSELSERIKAYYQFIVDYMGKMGFQHFVHTLGFYSL